MVHGGHELSLEAPHPLLRRQIPQSKESKEFRHGLYKWPTKCAPPIRQVTGDRAQRGKSLKLL